MIQLKEICKNFGEHKAMDRISLEANDKEILVLLGTSGCGKTTTLKMINRLIEPDSGQILINGKDIRTENLEVLRRNIGFVMQHSGLFPHYTIAQNIAILPDLLRWDKRKTQHRTAELLEKLNLQETVLNRFPHELSGGQQQRVGIARALIANTPVLLMDEPFGALDTITKATIHKEFKSLDELTNKTTMLVTHDVQEAFELGHRICLMNNGQIVQTGTPQEIIYRPVNDFVKNFFAESRLILEYKIATMKAVSPYLKTELALQNQLQSGSTWDALQTLSAENRFSADYETLIQAFSSYRKTQTA